MYTCVPPLQLHNNHLCALQFATRSASCSQCLKGSPHLLMCMMCPSSTPRSFIDATASRVHRHRPTTLRFSIFRQSSGLASVETQDASAMNTGAGGNGPWGRLRDSGLGRAIRGAGFRRAVEKSLLVVLEMLLRKLRYFLRKLYQSADM